MDFFIVEPLMLPFFIIIIFFLDIMDFLPVMPFLPIMGFFIIEPDFIMGLEAIGAGVDMVDGGVCAKTAGTTTAAATTVAAILANTFMESLLGRLMSVLEAQLAYGKFRPGKKIY